MAEVLILQWLKQFTLAEIVEEKVFEHYLEFPEEVRRVVINEMSTEDRCRFTRCSKLSQKEARQCKNYMYGMTFVVNSPTYLAFDAFHTKKNKTNNLCDYSKHFFLSSDGYNYVSYSTPFGGELWRTQLDSSTNLMRYACEYFKSMIQMFQNTIKKLEMHITGNYDFGIRSLNNLENLKLEDNTDIRRYISKIQTPLKEFHCYSPISEEIARNFEQIYEVQYMFYAENIHLTYAQFQKLSARRIYINIGILTEENISDFINSWQNNKLRKSFQYCRWSISQSTFNIRRLFQLLRIDHNFEERQEWGRIEVRRTTVDIKHKKDATKKAEIGFNKYVFDFYVLNQ